MAHQEMAAAILLLAAYIQKPALRPHHPMCLHHISKAIIASSTPLLLPQSDWRAEFPWPSNAATVTCPINNSLICCRSAAVDRCEKGSWTCAHWAACGGSEQASAAESADVGAAQATGRGGGRGMSGEQQMLGRLVAGPVLVATAAVSSSALWLVVPWAGGCCGWSAINSSTNAPPPESMRPPQPGCVDTPERDGCTRLGPRAPQISSMPERQLAVPRALQ